MLKYKLKNFVPYGNSICLDKRKTLWQGIENLFIDHKISINLYEVGVKGKFFQDDLNGSQAYNYCMAVQRLFDRLSFLHTRYHLYIEDDVFRQEWFSVVFDNAICQMKKKNIEFDVLYLCCDRRSGAYSTIDRNLLRVHHVDGFCGLIFNSKLKDIVMNLKPSNIGIDGQISSGGFQRKLECYSVYPNILDQKPGYNYNSHKTEDLRYWTWL